jgi:uncharacterized protein YndB with AHSA1/START domain
MTSQLKEMPQTTFDLAIARDFACSRGFLFKMWTEKPYLDRWSCPEGYTIPSSEAQVKPGGQWKAEMRSPDGESFRLHGVYREVVPGERLAFTHNWSEASGKSGNETLITVQFSEVGGKTRMNLHQSGIESKESRDGGAGGWAECFAKLDDLVEALKANEREINITRVMAHPIDRVFRAFSNPAGMATWWGPNGFTTTTKSMDFRVGGTWVFTMHGPDGTDWPNYVSYTAIKPNRLIAYDHGTSADNPALFKAEITFAEEAGQTRVSLKLTLKNAAERPHYVSFGAVEGGYQNLARLDAFLAKERRNP